MKVLFSLLLLIVLSSFIICDEAQDAKLLKKQMEQQTADTVMDSFVHKENKTEVFQVWHMLYKKEYKMDSSEGQRKFNNFVTNLNKIQLHNSGDSQDKLSVNEHSDKSQQELITHFALSDMNDKEYNTIFKRQPYVTTYFDHFEDEL